MNRLRSDQKEISFLRILLGFFSFLLDPSSTQFFWSLKVHSAPHLLLNYLYFYFYCFSLLFLFIYFIIFLLTFCPIFLPINTTLPFSFSTHAPRWWDKLPLSHLSLPNYSSIVVYVYVLNNHLYGGFYIFVINNHLYGGFYIFHICCYC